MQASTRTTDLKDRMSGCGSASEAVAIRVADPDSAISIESSDGFEFIKFWKKYDLCQLLLTN